MAITQALCNSYKKEILRGLHHEDHDYKLALYTANATLSKTTTAYTATEEVEGVGYIAGGKVLENFTVTQDGDVAILDFKNPEWPTSTITARGALIYNDSLPGKNAVVVVDFGRLCKSVNGLFEVLFPLPTKDTALIRVE